MNVLYSNSGPEVNLNQQILSKEYGRFCGRGKKKKTAVEYTDSADLKSLISPSVKKKKKKANKTRNLKKEKKTY